MTDITSRHPIAGSNNLPIPAAVQAATSSLPSSTLAPILRMASAVRRWWVTRTAAQALAGLDDATLRDLAIVRSDATRTARDGRR